MHEHYDADGKFTGHTVVTREPEWDETEVAKLLELRLYDAEVCSCGHHRSLTNRADAQFAIEVEKCDVCATVAKFQRIQAAEDEKQVKALGAKPEPSADWPDDGRRIAVRLVEMPDLTEDNK